MSEQSLKDLQRAHAQYVGVFEGLTYAALHWPRYAWMCILIGLIIFTWIMAAIWQWVMIVLIILLAGVVLSWFVMMWRRARLEADGYTQAQAYRAYLEEQEYHIADQKHHLSKNCSSNPNDGKLEENKSLNSMPERSSVNSHHSKVMDQHPGNNDRLENGERLEKNESDEESVEYKCKACGRPFVPHSVHDYYCSRFCVPHPHT